MSTQVLLMRLPRDPTRRPRLNRSFLLQTASSPRRLRFRRVFPQRIHRDPILERGLVRRVEEDPTAPRKVPQTTLSTRNGTKRDKGTQGGNTHFGTTGSSRPFAASTASFHRAVHRHHLQPGSRPIDRRLLPREALKSRNSFVRTPAGREGICGQRWCLATGVGGWRGTEGWMTDRQRRGCRDLRGPRDSSRRGSSPSWAFGRRGRGAS